MISVTAIAPINIATVKYWGKRNEKLNLPLNDSISMTLSTDYMCAKTTVAISPHFLVDKIWLNGKEEPITNPRLQNCLQTIRTASKLSADQLKWKTHICSENNFPTAAGLASSSAGFACLVFALAKLYDVVGDLSIISRQGSGSACRSMIGGFVRWHMGSLDDGSDSRAAQIAAQTHWPELRVVILVVNSEKKKISSTIGMQRGVETSQLLKYRIEVVIKQHLEKMIEAIKNKDFNQFAEITMRESNQFHAICQDTFPPNVYMNDISHAIVSFIHQYNAAANDYKVAYTFDAGPNACLFVLEKDLHQVLAAVHKNFPSTTPPAEFFTGIQVDISNEVCIRDFGMSLPPNVIKYIICTEIGQGPSILNSDESLLNGEGFPCTMSS